MDPEKESGEAGCLPRTICEALVRGRHPASLDPYFSIIIFLVSVSPSVTRR